MYSDSGAFVLKARTVRVECDVTEAGSEELAYPGLWAEVRRNLTNGEREQFREDARLIDERGEALAMERQQQSAAYIEAMKAAEDDPDKQRELIDAETAAINGYLADIEQIVHDRFMLIAPHIHGWNLADPGDGDVADSVPIPPPRADADQAYGYLNAELVNWLLRATMQAYRLGFPIGSRTSGASPEPTPEPSAESRVARGSRSRQSRKKSSGQELSESAT